MNINNVSGVFANTWQLLLDLARSFTFRDLIDVIIVTLLIYGLIKLVRETRAGQLVKGLILFVLIIVVSNVMDLQMISAIMTYFIQFAPIAILIVFQPEIRKALEQMGRSNVGKSLVNVVGSKDKEESRKIVRKAINGVVDAAGILQQLKMGALIVFERKTKLGEVVETGTLVNGDPSGQLISNIFFNKAPLHDGAMVIRDGKILAAGCILPLTKNDTLNASLGTRHRAALGISEESDAVVVVVSEETGQISVAVNGSLARNFNRDTLRGVLGSYLLPAEEKSEKRGSISEKIPLFKRRQKE